MEVSDYEAIGVRDVGSERGWGPVNGERFGRDIRQTEN
jgi:hypothetical protein